MTRRDNRAMPGRTVFWDVDTQVDFMLPSGALPVPGAERLLGNLGRLTAGARRLGITIVHTADDHDRADDEIGRASCRERVYGPV